MTFIDFEGILIVAELAGDGLDTLHYLSDDKKKYDDTTSLAKRRFVEQRY